VKRVIERSKPVGHYNWSRGHPPPMSSPAWWPKQKQLWRKSELRQRRPSVCSPGDHLVMDWAEAAPGLFVFCAILAYSRWRSVHSLRSEKSPPTLAMVAEVGLGLSDWMGHLKAVSSPMSLSRRRITRGSPPATALSSATKQLRIIF
jgi:hypothetical protein